MLRDFDREMPECLNKIQHEYLRMNNELPQELWDIPVLGINKIRLRYVNNGRYVGVIPASVSPDEQVASGRVVIDVEDKEVLEKKMRFIYRTYQDLRLAIIPMYDVYRK